MSSLRLAMKLSLEASTGTTDVKKKLVASSYDEESDSLAKANKRKKMRSNSTESMDFLFQNTTGSLSSNSSSPASFAPSSTTNDDAPKKKKGKLSPRQTSESDYPALLKVNKYYF